MLNMASNQHTEQSEWAVFTKHFFLKLSVRKKDDVKSSSCFLEPQK